MKDINLGEPEFENGISFLKKEFENGIACSSIFSFIEHI